MWRVGAISIHAWKDLSINDYWQLTQNRSHIQKLRNNVLTVLVSFNQLDTHFSSIILSNDFTLSNTRHQLNNHKHNTHPHKHLPDHRCIDAPHPHCSPTPTVECWSNTAGWKAVTLLVNSSGKRSHRTYCQFCVLPWKRVYILSAICRVEMYVMHSNFLCTVKVNGLLNTRTLVSLHP